MKQKILVVDDEPSISILLEFNLRLAGYEVHCVFNGEDVFHEVQTFVPDLIVLDLMLPRMDGIQVCRKLRSMNNYTPVIMLTAMQDLSDKIAGLDNGADDYMTKPFSPQELISRIQAILRRTQLIPGSAAAGPNEALQIGDLKVLPMEREVIMNGQTVDLTPKEFDLLVYLCRHKGKVLSRQQLLHGVWDYQFIGDTRIVDVHISHLREKIEDNGRNPDYIMTIRNVGYKLTDPAIRNNAN